jgi:hypothetical protein
MYLHLQYMDIRANGPYKIIKNASGNFVWGYIQKFPDWVNNEINNSNNKHLLRSNTNDCGGKTH